MVRVFLDKGLSIGAEMVDVVSEGEVSASMHERSLAAKPSVGPVLVKGENLVDVHPVADVTLQSGLYRAHPYDVVTFLRMFSDLWLAARECAYTVKRVRGEPQIVFDDVGIDGHVMGIPGVQARASRGARHLAFRSKGDLLPPIPDGGVRRPKARRSSNT